MNTSRTTLLFCTLVLTAGLLLGSRWEALGANRIRLDSTNAINTAGAWLGGTVGAADTAIWDATATIITNPTAINGPAANAIAWGGIKVSNPPVTINILSNYPGVAAANRVLNLGTLGLEVAGTQDLIVGCTFNAVAAQTWTIGAGRSLDLQEGRNTTFGANTLISGPGTIFHGRILDVTSNAVLTLTNDIVISTTPGTDTPLMRIAQTADAGNGTVNQYSGTVTLRRLTTAAVMQLGNNNTGVGTYNISGGVLNTRETTTKAINVANNTGSGFLNVSNTGMVQAAVINIGNDAANTGAAVSVSGSGIIEAHNIIVASVGNGSLTISGNGLVTVTNTFRIGANTANLGQGTVNLNGGRLVVPGLVRGTGTNVPTGGVLNFNGGTLSPYIPSLDFAPTNASNSVVTLNVLVGGAVIDTAGINITNRAPLLDGDGGAGGLTKQGAGVLTLLGTNTYTGPTMIQGGGLVLPTTTHAGGAITVADSAAFTVQVDTPGTSLSSSALTVGASSLSFNTRTNGNPTSAVITATDLARNGLTTVNVSAAGAGLSVGSFTLISVANAWTGAGDFTLGTLPAGVVANLVTNGNNLDLNVASVPLNLTWNGTPTGDWVIGPPANWQGGFSFANGSFVTFDDSAAGTYNVNVPAVVTPGGIEVLFDHSISNYSLSGLGGIAGNAGLTKLGTGTLSMGVSNSYSGPTTIGAGTMQLSASEVIPNGIGLGDVTLDGTLDVAGNIETINGLTGTGLINNSAGSTGVIAVGSGNVSSTFNGVISNSGAGLALSKVGGGIITLQSANHYTGGTDVSGGTLRIDPGVTLGSIAAPWRLAGVLQTFASLTNTAPQLEVSGTGTIATSNGVTVSVSGLIVTTNDGVLVKNGNGTLNFAQGGTFGALRPQDGRTVLASGQGITNNLFVNLGNVAAGTAEMVLNNSVWRVADSGEIDFNIANANGSSGILHITNNARLEIEDFWIGKVQNTTGTVYQSSGVVTNVADLGDPIRFAGNNNAAHSTAIARYFLSGGRFDVIDETQIGANGTALLEITGGQFHSWSGALSVGRYAGSFGTVTVTSGSFNRHTNANFTLANAGTATLNVSGSGVVDLAGNLVMGSAAGSTSTVNLATGGLIRAARVLDGDGRSVFNFNGGTLEAAGDSSDFIRDLTNVVIMGGGGTINSSSNTITIRQDFSGAGELTKLGTGTLILTSSNSIHFGDSLINEGTVLIAPAYVGISPFQVGSSGAFGAQRTAANASAVCGFANFQNGSTVAIDLGTFGNSASPALIITGNVDDELTGFLTAGSVNVRVSGANLTPGTVTLIQYNDPESIGPGGALLSGTLTLPRGVVGSLSDTGSEIRLTITSVSPLIWTGATDNLWDINATTNWAITNLATVYLDNDASVLFGNSGANKSINITSNVSPSQVTVSNTPGNDYTFGGLGLITGPGGLTKIGTGTLFLANSNNTYTGATLINEGTLKFGTNDVLPNSTASAQTVDIAAGATLDVNGYNDTIRAIAGAGTIENTGASNAVLIIGANGASGSFSGVIQDTAGDLLIQKNGNGTNMLANAASTWNGGLFINAGTIEFSADDVFGSGPVIIGAGGTLANIGPHTITNLLRGTNAGDATLHTAGGDLHLQGIVNIDGPELRKTGANTLVAGSSAVVNLGTASGFDLNGGSLSINSASWTHANDGFRVRATTNFPFIEVNLQFGGSMVLQGGANFQLGNTADTNLTSSTRVTNVFNLGTGTLSLGNGTLNVGAAVGNAGIFVQADGTVGFTNAANNTGLVLGAATNTSGEYQLNGGTLTAARVRKTGTNNAFARFVFGGGTLKALNGNVATNFMSGLDEALVTASGAVIDTDAFNVDIDQALIGHPLSPNGGLVKDGSGTLALNGTNTFSGLVIVNAGVVRGLGSVVNSVTGAGRIGGGDSTQIGTFTINGSSSAAGGALMRVAKTGVVLTNDRVNVVGVLGLDGNLTVTSSGDPLAAGDQFDLFDAPIFSGGFTSFTLPALPPNLSWDISQVNTTGVIRVVSSPKVTSVIYGTGTVRLIGTGDLALAGQNYRVLTSTDMTLPYTSWTVAYTGVFDGSGNFDTGAFAVTPSDTKRFYVVVYP